MKSRLLLPWAYRRASGFVALARTEIARQRQARAQTVAHVDPTAVLYAEGLINNLGRDSGAIRVGGNTHIRGTLLVFAHGGEISIGEWCYVGEQTRIWSGHSIRIGHRVLISHGCELHDCNAHPIGASARHRHFRAICEGGHPAELPDVASRPIVLENDVWVGFGSTILKGVTVGEKSIVAAKSLVAKDVPPGVIVAGNPARVVRSLSHEELE